MARPIRLESFLANLPLFRGLPAEDLARLAAGTGKRSLRRGEILFREGEPSTGVHAVVYGRVKLFHRDGDGRERVVEVVGPGRSFGGPVMFLERPYLVSASALEDCVVLHVDKDTVLADVRTGLERRFDAVASRRGFDPADVDAGRAYVASYVDYVHHVERLRDAATAGVEASAHRDAAPAHVRPAHAH
jgi:signal-transduction protein with cAMP-binding, CBS, and nucleotidyltransferase domain